MQLRSTFSLTVADYIAKGYSVGAALRVVLNGITDGSGPTTTQVLDDLEDMGVTEFSKKSREEKQMKISLKDCFNDEGNVLFDPYRFDEENETPTRIALKNLLFTEDGWLTNRGELAKLISTNKDKWLWTCDAIGLYHAEQHASSTKSSYPTYYYFR